MNNNKPGSPHFQAPLITIEPITSIGKEDVDVSFDMKAKEECSAPVDDRKEHKEFVWGKLTR